MYYVSKAKTNIKQILFFLDTTFKSWCKHSFNYNFKTKTFYYQFSSKLFVPKRDVHVRTPLRCASERFLRTNMPFFPLKHMTLKGNLPFDSFRYMLSSHNFFRTSEISTRIEQILRFLMFSFFFVSICTQITNTYMF